ncbi:MAG: CPBP family intramembrane metalloprotease [Anaerolineaceae bacterium]|nr:CPBP family intramembrane metalloprotease [Anaerolineaceae bacterium]
MEKNRLTGTEWFERIVLALLFVSFGALIIIVFSPLRPLLDKIPDYLGRIGLIIVLLILVLTSKKSKALEKYQPIMIGLLILLVAVSLSWISGIYLLSYIGVNDRTPAGFSLIKLNESVLSIAMVILLTKMSGFDMGSIYIQKGNLKKGLSIGLIAFGIAAIGAPFIAPVLFQAQGLTVDRVLKWLPWIFIFVFANAALEEILYRGLFLRKLEPFFGKFFSSFLIAFVFTALHLGVSYTVNQYIFLVILVPLALVWGWIMQKTDSVWGSILFHAGMDIPVILGILSNL